jgi:exopolysaccharide biosynthesis polyprenyl glycosylphosphotransferase
MLVEFLPSLSDGSHANLLQRTIGIIASSTRETDVTGWYAEGAMIGTIFTELGEGNETDFLEALDSRFKAALAASLSAADFGRVRLSLHAYPEEWETGADDGLSDLWTGKQKPSNAKPVLWIKRAIDILGSLAAIIVLLPIAAIIAAAIKLTSKGPVLFRQQRVGQYGRKFTFLKFRSMFVANDQSIHQKYVESFIAGSAEKSGKVFKLTADPRITPVGRFLRRTSLDELPQFVNVLIGDMALVGPRPPIPYEVKKYDLWHRRRFLSVKPGITGLWQVTGRSRTTFDEMVRMDLRYASSWSVWLDLKILVMTPLAVFKGDGAY